MDARILLAHTHRTTSHLMSVLHRAKPGDKVVDHPCLLEGTNVTFHDGTHDGVQHAIGTSDHDACLELQERIFSDCEHTPEGKCSPMQHVPPPDTKGKFLAFSYFYDVLTEFLHTTEPTIGEIKDAAKRVCRYSHAEIHGKHSETYEPKNPEFLKRACQVSTKTTFVRITASFQTPFLL